MHPLSAEQIQQLLQGIRVPPQPQIMVDLQLEQLAPEPDLQVISALIAQDPGLSGALLKIINSADIGLEERLGSIRQAVELLGGGSVMNLINALSIRSELDDATILQLNAFWDSAQDVALTCLNLAHRLGYSDPDEAYALGLFHDCGIPLLLQRCDPYMNVLEEAYRLAGPDLRVVDTENHHLNTNHAVLGYYAARSWRLPERIGQAIAHHHNLLWVFGEAGDGLSAPLKTLLALLKMAENICACHQVLGKQAKDGEWAAIQSEVLDHVGLSEYDYENLRDSLRDQGPG